MRFALLCTLTTSALFSLPTNGAVLSGKTEIGTPSLETLEIIASDRSILEWSDFSIEEGETVRFIQPHEKASVLNQVLEAYPSRLLGRLESNGQVILVNPNGILVGKNAAVHTGSFLASSFDLNQELYKRSGEVSFLGGSSDVVNLGSIKTDCGDARLLGARIENHGMIEAHGGTASLFASGTGAHSGTLVSNREAKIEAASIDIQRGSLIDVSGNTAAGSILVHGDLSFISAGAALRADARETGDGGNIVILGDKSTYFYGAASAQGGTYCGNGGFIEVSSKGTLAYDGLASTLAANGAPGQLLLDPTDITIMTAGGNTNITFGGACGANTYCDAASAGTSNITPASVQANLAAGNVTITTASAAAQNGDITIIDPLTFNTNIASTLTLIANRDITISATSGISFGNLSSQQANFQASRNITVSAQILNNSANANGGNLAMTAGANGGVGSITLNSAALAALQYNGALAGTLTLTANNGITLAAVGPGTAIGFSRAGTVTLIDNSNVGITLLRSISHSSAVAGGVTVQELGAGPIQINQSVAGSQLFVGSAFFPTTFNAPNSDITIFGSGNTLSGQIGFNPGAGAQVLTGAINVCCRNLTLSAGNNNSASAGVGHGFYSGNGNARTLGANIVVNASQNILLQGGGVGSGNADARIGHGCTALQPANLTQDGNITVTAGGRIDLFSGSGTESHSWIGHGANSNGGANAQTTISGNIIVAATGTFATANTGSVNLVSAAAGTRSHARIGHNLRDQVVSLIGNIDVLAAGDLVVQNNRVNNYAYIGHFSSDNALFTGSIQGNYTVKSGGNITLGNGAGATAFIGYKRTQPTQPTDPPFIGQLEVLAANNLTVSALGVLTDNFPFITLGIYVTNNAGAVPAGTTANVYVGVNGNLTVTNNNPNVRCCIESPNNLYLAVRGSIIGSNAPQAIAGIGTTNNIGGTTFLRCLGDVDARSIQIGTGLGLLTLGPPVNAPAARSVDARASGNLVLGVGFTTVTGSTLFEADSSFNTGDLWTFAGGSLTSIAGGGAPPFVSLPLNINFATFCPAATAIALPLPFRGSIPNAAIASDGAGGVSINTALSRTLAGGANSVNLQSNSGPISIHSAALQSDGATAQNLTLGAGINQLNLTTVSGSIDISGAVCTDAFNSVAITGALTTAGSICVRSLAPLNINFPVSATGPGSSLSLISATGNLNLAANVSTLGGPLLLSAGYPLSNNCCAAPAACCCDAFHCCCTPAACGTITPNVASVLQTAGAISTTDSGGNIGTLQIQAATDITLGGAATGASSQTGSIQMCANNNVNINRIVSSTAGPITITADADDSGSGNLNIAANITSLSGNISLRAGAIAGCFSPSRFSSINHTAGTINPGTGNIDANARYDLNISSPGVSWLVSTGSLHTLAGHDTNLTNTTLQKTGAGLSGATDFLMISGRNMNMIGSRILAIPSFVTLVVDNCFPVSPLIGPGAFLMDASSAIDPVNLRIFTALRGQNSILGTLNGQPFVPGALYANSATEHWCQYFAFPFAYPFANLGTPYTIFYKDCLQQVANQAQIVTTEFLLDLHPYNEFPGWMEEFWVEYKSVKNSYSSLVELNNEPYYFRRRHLNVINHPKTWTAWFE